MIPDLPKFDIQNKKEVSFEYIFEQVSDNITNIIAKYENILNPQNNSMTRKYLNEGNDQQTAYALSFSTTIMICLQINGINVV